jgi:hypothetical protein
VDDAGGGDRAAGAVAPSRRSLRRGGSGAGSGAADPAPAEARRIRRCPRRGGSGAG